MSEAAQAVAAAPEINRIVELPVSGHLMTLDTGLFCIFQPPGSPAAGANGLPGVRISPPPGGPANAVEISTFRDDGWLNGGDGAALVKVPRGPAQILVTVYQAPGATANGAPRLQVLRLAPEARPEARPAAPPAAANASTAETAILPPDADIVAHVQRTGDVGARFDEWVGVRASRLWIEGFAIRPPDGLKPEDIEYQAVLGRDWLSPWVEGGKFCGSRGMALPLLGLRLRLKGAAASAYSCACTASFVDGTTVGPVGADQVCQAESLAPMEAFQILLQPRQQTPASSPDKQPDATPVRRRPQVPPRKTARRRS